MNSIIYGYCAPAQGNDLELYIDGNLRTYYSQWSSYKTFQVGTNDAAEHTVELRGTVNRDNIDGTFYYLDLAEFQDVIDEISQHQVHTTELKDGYVKCEYTADESEQLLLTVPYDLSLIHIYNKTCYTQNHCPYYYFVFLFFGRCNR